MKQRALTVEGMARGIECRSFVFRLLRQHGLAGCILSRGRRIHIEVQGETSELIGFAESLRAQPLAPMCVDGVSSKCLEPDAAGQSKADSRLHPRAFGLPDTSDQIGRLHAS